MSIRYYLPCRSLRQKIEKKTVVHLIKCGRPPEQLKLQFQAHAMPEPAKKERNLFIFNEFS